MTTTITIADKAINTTYQDKTGTTTSAHGTGAKFDVTKTNGVYTVVLDTAAGSDGTGYVAGDTITLTGSTLGGVNTTNDLILTVATVGAGGKIATFGAVGVGRVGDGVVDIQVDVTGTTGTDTYTVPGKSTEFTVTKNAHDITLVSGLATNTQFTLADHERVVFTDKSFAYDAGASHVYTLLAAGLGVGGVTDALEGLGIKFADLGWTDKQLAQGLINTSTFQTAAGMVSTTDNADFVKFVYTNVMGVAPTAAQAKVYTDMLDAHTTTQADLLAGAASLDSFHTTIGLTGILATTGIEYTPVVG